MRANGLFCASRLLTPMIRAVYLDQARRYSAAQPKKRCRHINAIFDINAPSIACLIRTF